MADKKYYWLKLKEGFFEGKAIKFLRSQPSGDRMCIVYLQLQLKSLKTVGLISYDKLLPSCEEEIAFDLGEEVELVRQTVDILERCQLVERTDSGDIYLTAVEQVTGCEGASAERKRQQREREQLEREKDQFKQEREQFERERNLNQDSNPFTNYR